MGSTSAPIPLHRPDEERHVALSDADAAAVRTQATARLAEEVGHPPAVLLTTSCSGALAAAADVISAGPGTEVIVPAFTFPTTVTPFLARGARLRFADADPDTGSVSTETISGLIGPRTRAIVVMHYAGVGADIDGLLDDLAELDVSLVEDAAQGLFATRWGRPLGRLGRFGALSFHHTKNVSTVEGGALLVNDETDVGTALVAVDKGTNREEFDAGRVTSYEWSGPGSALRMPEAATRLLADDLERGRAEQPRRHLIWDRYAAELRTWAERHDVTLPVVPDGAAHPAHLFHLVLPDGWAREDFVQGCRASGVQTARHYGSLPTSQFGRTVADPADRCPVADVLGERLVRIPLHAALSDPQVDRVLEVVTAQRP